MGFSDSPKKAHLLLSSAAVDKDDISSSSSSSSHINGCNFVLLSNERVVACRFDDWRKKQEEVGGATTPGPEFFSSLKVKLPELPSEEMEVAGGEVVDGLSTPTSSDHKIPDLVCPPAPRKPKPVPSAAAAAAKKRSAASDQGCRKRVFLDLTNEVDSMFPEAIRADFRNKIKKVRKESS